MRPPDDLTPVLLHIDSPSLVQTAQTTGTPKLHGLPSLLGEQIQRTEIV